MSVCIQTRWWWTKSSLFYPVLSLPIYPTVSLHFSDLNFPLHSICSAQFCPLPRLLVGQCFHDACIRSLYKTLQATVLFSAFMGIGHESRTLRCWGTTLFGVVRYICRCKCTLSTLHITQTYSQAMLSPSHSVNSCIQIHTKAWILMIQFNNFFRNYHHHRSNH